MKTILIVDDNKDILHALQTTVSIAMKGCTVLTAPDGKRGQEIMRRTRIDLVLTDIDMPIMNGYQFIERTRNEHPGVPVCVMAGNCRPEVLARLSGLGVTHCIEKPFQVDCLTRIISELLDERAVDPGANRTN